MIARERRSLGMVGIAVGLLLAPSLFASCGNATGGAGGSASGGAGQGGQGGDDLTIASGGGPQGSGGAPLCSDAMAPPGEGGDPDGGDPGCAAVEPGLTYMKDVQPILVQRCTGELCHLVPSYSFLVDQPTAQCCDGRLRVAPGDAAHSYLMNKLTGLDLCSGAPMPFGKPMLPDAQIQRIHDWICDGAPP